MSTDNKAGLQTFNTAFPLNFSLQNQFQDEDLPVLYIVNNIDANSASQKLKVQISATNEEHYSLKGFKFAPPVTPTIPVAGSATAQLVPSNASISPSEDQYNLAVAIRPGTLRSAVEENFAISLYKGLMASFGTSNPNSCIVNGPIPRKSDGALVWYIAFEKDIETPIKPLAEWNKVEDGKAMKKIIFQNDGSLIGIDSNNNFYTRSKIEGGAWSNDNLPTWLKGKQAVSIAAYSNSNFVVLPAMGTNKQMSHLIDVENGNDSWQLFPNNDGFQNLDITIMPDNTIAGIGLNYFLYSFILGQTWQSVDPDGYIVQLASKPDGSLLALSQEGIIYSKSGLNTGSWSKIDDSIKVSTMAVNKQGAILAYDIHGNFYQQSNSQNLLEFELEGISAKAGTGTRSSQIEMLFGNVTTNQGGTTMNFKRSQSISIINHEGHSYAPLHFGVIGDNSLLNKEGHQNAFSIFFETINGKPIALNQSVNNHTKIHFDFPYSDGGKNLMPFGKSGEVDAYLLSDSEVYPFKSKGPLDPISGAAYDASSNTSGSIRYTADFKDLTAEQKALETHPSQGISESQAFYDKEIVPTSGIAEKIYTAKQQSKLLVDFITASDGPIQYFLYAAGQMNISIDAAINYGTGYAYFFIGHSYLKYDIATSKVVSGYPLPINETYWPGLTFNQLDAAYCSNDKAYFFKDDQYTAFDIASNKADDNYPKAITDGYPGLVFGKIDAAINWGNGKLYFFSGDQYARFDIASNKVDPGFPSSFKDSWSTLTFDQLTAAINWENNKAYFFKNNQYVSFDISTDRQESNHPITFEDLQTIFDFPISVTTAEGSGGGATLCIGDSYINYDMRNGTTNGVKFGLQSFFPNVGFGQVDSIILYSWEDSNTSNKSVYYLFNGNQCIKYEINTVNGETMHNGEELSIADHWPGVTFTKIDAAFNAWNGYVYLFSGNQYTKFSIADNHVVSGYPLPINGTYWDGVSFDSLTAAVSINNDNEKVDIIYLFKDDEYICFDWRANKAFPGYPVKMKNWKKMFVPQIQAAVNLGNGEAYFFILNGYIRYNTTTGKADAKLVNVRFYNEKNLFNEPFNAAFNDGEGSAWFFGDTYAYHFDIQKNKIGGHEPWSMIWTGLNFSKIDAAINWGNGYVYFFSGNQYSRCSIKSKQVDAGYPLPIKGHWGGLPFESITAAINWGDDMVYFFNGIQYVSYDKNTDKVSAIQTLTTDIENMFNVPTTVSSFLTKANGALPANSTSCLLPVNLSPTGANPAIPFDETTWTTLFNAQSSGVSFTDLNSSTPTTAITQWDNLPESYTPAQTPDYTFSEPNFLSYVKGNFSFLVQQLKDLNPLAIGTTIVNGQTVEGILPSKAIYEFFKIQYELDKSINTAADITLSNLGVQQFASYQATIDSVKNRAKLNTPISQGPDFMLDTSSRFSSTNWNETFAKATTKFGSEKTLLNKSEVGSSSQDWSDHGYITYLNNQFQSVVDNHLDVYHYNGKKYVVTSQSLYDFLWLSYQKSLPSVKPETHAELYNPSSYAFNFSNIQVSGDDGWVTVAIRVENLPGFWDSSFQVSIQKSKTIFAPTLALGRGGPNGRIKLSPTDPNYINSSGLNPGSRIDFLSAGENEQKQPNVSIEEHYGLNIYGSMPEKGQTGAVGVPTQSGTDDKAGQPVKVREADFLIVDGRLGIGNVPQGDISGDFTVSINSEASNPNEKFRVIGDVYINGHIGTSGDHGIGGDLTVNGNISDQFGPIIPVGTMIQRYFSPTNFGHAKSPPIPAGWLECNGENIVTTYLLTKNKEGQSVYHSEYLALFLYLFINGSEVSGSAPFTIGNSTIVKINPTKNEYYFFNPSSGNYSDKSVSSYEVCLPNISNNNTISLIKY